MFDTFEMIKVREVVCVLMGTNLLSSAVGYQSRLL